jgi:hypothetical protein
VGTVKNHGKFVRIPENEKEPSRCSNLMTAVGKINETAFR